jgi:hypothetical protein
MYSGVILDLGNRFEKMGVIANSMEKNIRNMVDFVRLIPGFLELSTKDQLSLIKCKYIALHKILHIEQNEPRQEPGMYSGVIEEYEVPAPLTASFVLVC